MNQIEERTVREFRGYVEEFLEIRSEYTNEKFRWLPTTPADREQMRAERAAADEAVLRAFWASEAATGHPVPEVDQGKQRTLMSLQGVVQVRRHVPTYGAPQRVLVRVDAPPPAAIAEQPHAPPPAPPAPAAAPAPRTTARARSSR